MGMSWGETMQESLIVRVPSLWGVVRSEVQTKPEHGTAESGVGDNLNELRKM